MDEKRLAPPSAKARVLPSDAPQREEPGRRFGRVLRSTALCLLLVAAVAVIITVLTLPMLQITGTSMADTLLDGDVVLAARSTTLQPGDMIAFYHNDSILIKRVIACPGDWVDVKADGTVYVNRRPLDEPYLSDRALGECDIRLPYQVPDEALFVMGDYRSVSIDSRSTAVGCVNRELVVGRLVFRLWPLSRFGSFN